MTALLLPLIPLVMQASTGSPKAAAASIPQTLVNAEPSPPNPKLPNPPPPAPKPGDPAPPNPIPGDPSPPGPKPGEPKPGEPKPAEPKPGQPGTPPVTTGAKPADKAAAPAKPPKPGPKPYKEVITAEAKSDPGLFTVHQVDDKYYWEIPANMFDRVMLWQTEIAALPAGRGYGGTSAGAQVVKWTRRNNKVYLRLVDYSIRDEEKGNVAIAVEAASLDPIVMAFDVRRRARISLQ